LRTEQVFRRLYLNDPIYTLVYIPMNATRQRPLTRVVNWISSMCLAAFAPIRLSRPGTRRGAHVLVLVLTWSGFCHLWAQEEPTVTFEDLLEMGQEWVEENLDEPALQSLRDTDLERVHRFLADLRKRFEGEYVIDLAPLKRTAQAILPLLERYEETLPYAGWLRTRLDYFDLADQYRLSITPPKTKPGQPPPPEILPNPTPVYQRKAWQKQMARRARPESADVYVSRLKRIFAAHQVPEALVWLAEVESSFNPNARSPADAAGLFQLLPATAKNFGLTLRPADERLHPEKNAKAAAQYLNYLNGRFKDWPLALAAYNAGEGRVSSLLNRHKAKSFDGIARHLPAETQMYVPKVEATLLRREGMSLSKLPTPRGS
jgi:membrane-bound lytic murein transglycosylase D